MFRSKSSLRDFLYIEGVNHGELGDLKQQIVAQLSSFTILVFIVIVCIVHHLAIVVGLNRWVL